MLLTATPVNNTLFDLHALVSLFIRNDATFAADGIPSIYKCIKRAQMMDPDALSPEHLFDLMDHVAVRRTRRFIKWIVVAWLLGQSSAALDFDQA